MKTLSFVTALLLFTMPFGFTGGIEPPPDFSLPKLSQTVKPSVQSINQQPKIAVHVSVACKNRDVKASIESHLKRELRSLQDVLLVSKYAKDYRYLFELRIVAVESHYTSGQKTGGIAISFLFIEKLGNFIKNRISTQSQKAIEPIIDNIHYIHNVGVISDDTRNVSESCKSIIVDFDTGVLEPIREIWQE